MPRGRHRHSPPLHRLLPPSAIAGVSLVCALAPWVFTEPMVLRSLAAAAAATAVLGAIVLRRWDTQAGRQVADLTRARVSDEWRFEERVAELETDLEESRELRVRLEHKLRAKRAELAGLRNEHAALLRRYATAETERASALEGRRLLEIETSSDLPALPPARQDRAESAGVREEAAAMTGATAEAAGRVREEAAESAGTAESAESSESVGTSGTAEAPETPDDEKGQAAPAVFSPAGSHLFLRAKAALARFDADDDRPATAAAAGTADTAAKAGAPADASVDASPDTEPTKDAPAASDGGAAESGPAREDEAQGQPEAADAQEHAVATSPARSAKPAQQPTGHFTVPTAVAVVPAAPVRRPVVEGGFDFFGTKQDAPSDALEAVQNEDLADVVGQEALALHKAESESQFKPADEEARGVGQVIDLTAHDETEQIDVQGLRTAAS
ncbi:hypothetical protein [Streptomyces sp. NPDC046197]|uniref:hypothetical protein n=1 Tax=Streptomyces sp. NPDC046197 TaxID=3154337 RepID=UPI0033D6C534